MTRNQVVVMMHATSSYPEWVKARHPGERVTLASLYRGGFLDRRARRGLEGGADAAYEYRPTRAFIRAVRKEDL